MKKYVDKDKLQEFTTKLTGKYKQMFSSPLVASTVADMTDEEKVYVYVGSETGYTNGNWYYYDGSDWVSGGVYNAVAVETDDTLLVQGKAADSKAVGDAIDEVKADLAELEGGGLTDEAKQALMDIVEHIGLWTDDHGQDYRDALYDALYPPTPPKTVVSISAVYTQSGTVYDTDTLDSLKTDLVVTATYDDSTTGAVTAYTLSGTLEVGTSTITVSYSGKTTTFTVTVTEAPASPIYQWENLGTSLVDSIGGITATTNGTQNSEDECIDLASGNKYIDFGEIYAYDRTYIIEFGTSNAETLTAHARFFGVDSDTSPDSGGDVFSYRMNTGFAFYVSGSWSSTIVDGGTSEVRNMFGDSAMKVYIDSNGYAHVYKNSTLLGSSPSAFKTPTSGLKVIIGSSSGDRLADLQVKSMTVYSGEVI